MAKGKCLDPDLVKTVFCLYDKLASIRAVGEVCGKSASWVSHLMTKYDKETGTFLNPKPKGRQRGLDDTVFEAYFAMKPSSSRREAAKDLGISRSQVHRYQTIWKKGKKSEKIKKKSTKTSAITSSTLGNGENCEKFSTNPEDVLAGSSVDDVLAGSSVDDNIPSLAVQSDVPSILPDVPDASSVLPQTSGLGFDEVRRQAIVTKRWLLVNIHNRDEPVCRKLLKECLLDTKVQALIMDHVWLWHVDHDSPQVLRCGAQKETPSYPRLAILNPLTGEKVRPFRLMPATRFHTTLSRFLSLHPSFDPTVPRSVTHRPRPRIPLTYKLREMAPERRTERTPETVIARRQNDPASDMKIVQVGEPDGMIQDEGEGSRRWTQCLLGAENPADVLTFQLADGRELRARPSRAGSGVFTLFLSEAESQYNSTLPH